MALLSFWGERFSSALTLVAVSARLGFGKFARNCDRAYFCCSQQGVVQIDLAPLAKPQSCRRREGHRPDPEDEKHSAQQSPLCRLLQTVVLLKVEMCEYTTSNSHSGVWNRLNGKWTVFIQYSGFFLRAPQSTFHILPLIQSHEHGLIKRRRKISHARCRPAHQQQFDTIQQSDWNWEGTAAWRVAGFK